MEDRYLVECCDYIHAHQEIIDRVQKKMPGEDTLYDLAELFRIFGDSTRIRILYVLFEAEMCVCDIAQLLGMTQSAISHQLRSLKNARLVRAQRGSPSSRSTRPVAWRPASRTASARAVRSSSSARSEGRSYRTSSQPSGAVMDCAWRSHRSQLWGSLAAASGPTTAVDSEYA